MFDELGEIDTSAIEELSQIKQEQELLEDRLTRMEEQKDQVSEEVYLRVREDYQARGLELDDQANPLKQQAQVEYGKLRELRERLRSVVDTARLDKEELEFRHRLGEYDDETFGERLAESEKEIGERQGELEQTEELTQRFVDAFRSREELEEDFSSAPPLVVEDVTVEDATVEDATLDTVDADESLAEFPPDVPPDPPADLPLTTEEASQDVSSWDEEALVDRAFKEDSSAVGAALTEEVLTDDDPTEDTMSDLLNGDDPTTSTEEVARIPPPPPLPGAAEGSEATVLLKGPRLVIQRDEVMEEIRLGIHPVTIGRAVKNEIRFLSTSVSRFHAKVVLGEDGYAVSDTRSGNGTLVNGEPVSGERALRDGDMVQVGSEILVFRDR